MSAKWLKPPSIVPWPWGVRKSDAELSKVVLPKIGDMYIDGKDNELKRLRRAVASCTQPQDHEIYGDPVERYLKAMGTPGCCTPQEPCQRHVGALAGRDWKTGKYLAKVKYR
jgi:hypothetical protein